MVFLKEEVQNQGSVGGGVLKKLQKILVPETS